MLEFACGNWSKAPHIQLDKLLGDAAPRRAFSQVLDRKGIAISALNCSGNPCYPGECGRRHEAVTRKTFALAGRLGICRIVMMSGLPGGAPWESTANWVVTGWPRENQEILRYQWDDVIVPYWRGLVAEAKSHGIEKLCLEMHGR